jgi:hypothetical protein
MNTDISPFSLSLVTHLDAEMRPAQGLEDFSFKIDVPFVFVPFNVCFFDFFDGDVRRSEASVLDASHPYCPHQSLPYDFAHIKILQG